MILLNALPAVAEHSREDVEFRKCGGVCMSDPFRGRIGSYYRNLQTNYAMQCSCLFLDECLDATRDFLPTSTAYC